MRRRTTVVTLAVVAALLVAAGTASATLSTFRTPTGNIGCLYDSSDRYLRCDIRSGLEPMPPRPKGCGVDWGFSLNMNRTGRARITCAGDTALDPRARPLAYGSTWRRGGLACTSRTAGLMSRERWRRL